MNISIPNGKAAVLNSRSTATSMIAAILFEHYQVPLHECASISIMRYANSGPPSIIYAMYGSMRQSKILVLSAIMLLSTTTLLQLTSTVLATDLGFGAVASHRQINATVVGMSLDNPFNVTRDSFVDYWNSQPPDFPTFAESYEDMSDEEPLDGVLDTGTIIRALLPIQRSAERTAVEHFDGIATLLDLRVVCVRPITHPGLTIGLTPETGFMLNGSLSPVAAPKGLINPQGLADPRESANSITYNITGRDADDPSSVSLTRMQRLPFAHGTSNWPVIQKVMSTGGPALVSTLDPRYPNIISNDTLSYHATNVESFPQDLKWYVSGDSVPLLTGRSYIVVNITASENLDTLTDADNWFFSQGGTNDLVISADKEWLRFEIPQIPGWLLSTTLCFDSITSIDANITATSEGVTEEPVAGIWNVSTRTFSTVSHRIQLGTNHSAPFTLQERGVMTLHNTTAELRRQVEPWYTESNLGGWDNFSLPFQDYVHKKIRGAQTHGINMCAECGLVWRLWPNGSGVSAYQSVNDPFQNSIFQDTLLDSGDISQALQAYYTSISRTVYYATLPRFDRQGQQLMSRFGLYQFPRTTLGLTAVSITIAVHCLLVAVIVLFFLVKTKTTFIGDNAWQSVAQVALLSERMHDVLFFSTTNRDSVVKKHIHRVSPDDRVVQPDRRNPRGPVEVSVDYGQPPWLQDRRGNSRPNEMKDTMGFRQPQPVELTLVQQPFTQWRQQGI